MDFDATQDAAVSACTNTTKRLVAITGQAGTGKTTIMRQVYEHFYSKGIEPVMCAPTGKAAKRIQEATGVPAMTIHRLLEYPHPGEMNPKTGRPYNTTDPKRDRLNPIESRVVLCDEYAMVNTEVHRNLLDALPSGGLIRMFGDANQLPPIEMNKKLQGKPSPFVTMLNDFSGIRLTKIHRQAEGSNIIQNGNRIIQGIMPRRADDFSIKITDTPIDVITEIVAEGLEGNTDFGKLQYQIIAPTKPVSSAKTATLR